MNKPEFLFSPILESDKGDDIELLPVTEKVDVQLDQSFKDIIGDDPSVPKSLDLVLHQALSSRLKFWTEEGMAKKDSEGLLTKYKKLQFLEAPKMTPPVEMKLSLSAKKRDEYWKTTQNAIGSAIMVIGSVASTLITEKESIEPTELFERLYHGFQILDDTYHKTICFEKSNGYTCFLKSNKRNPRQNKTR